MRINGFHQISAFYSIVFSQEYDFKPQHISLYMFLLNQNNRNNWVEWFKCPIDLGMTGSCIGSKKTYYACLDDLQNWGLLNYEKGENMWKSPKISLVVLKSTSTYTSTIPQSEPLPIPLPEPLPTPIYKPITSNLQPKTNTRAIAPNENQFSKPTINEISIYLSEKYPSANKNAINTFAEKFWNHYENNGWKVGKNKMKNWIYAFSSWSETIQKDLFNRTTQPIGTPNFSSKNY